jgi:hypothetical protein
MPSSRLQFASVALRLGCLSVLLLGSARVACASDSAAPGAPPCAVAATPETSTPDLTDGLWRLAGGDASPVYPYDPATFVGPLVPLAVLFAPAPAPIAAGMRIELEPGARPATSRGVAPAEVPLVRYADVFDRLTPVRHADGSLSIDLTGITMTEAQAWIDADGVHLMEPGQTRPVLR